MASRTRYVEMAERDVPDGVRFDVPGRLAGQIVEVAYGGFSRAPHDEGDPFRRVTDRSIGAGFTRFYRRVEGR